MTGAPYALSPLELSAGQVLAPLRPAELPSVPAGWSPLDGLCAALVPALERSPCVVAFSGGRDSSAVLAAATYIARREGLDPPIPFSVRYRGAPESDEAEWQELVVGHLGIEDWVRAEVESEDSHVLGPAATGLLRRHGVLWPSNLHLQLPVIEAARGGSLVTGAGGDEIFDGVRWMRTAAVLAREARPRPRDVLGVGYALSPRLLKRAAFRWTLRSFGSWLRPKARRRVRAALAAHAATEPFQWADRLAWWSRQPYLLAQHRNLAAVAAESGVAVFAPLVDGSFVSVLGGLPPDRHYRDRTAALRMIFGDLLPEAIVTRRSKASFNHIDAPEPRLEFLACWNGEGVDPLLVNLDRLRTELAKPLTLPSTTPLLQAAWLALDAESPASRGEPAQSLGHGG